MTDLLKLGSQAIELMTMAKQLADNADRIISIVKQDPDAWEKVKAHYIDASARFDEITRKRGLDDEK